MISRTSRHTSFFTTVAPLSVRCRFFVMASIIVFLNLLACLSAIAAGSYDRINVTSSPYLAIPNDGIDDTPQIMAAINSGTAASKSIYFPPGTYNFTGLMTLQANKSYRIYGEGPGVSTILFSTNGSNPTAGIYAPTMGLAALNVEGLTLQANSNGSGTAISASFEPTAKFHTATIHNVQIIGSARDGSGTYWTNGIYLYKAANTVIDKVHISGNKNVTLAGITWDAGPSSTGLQMSNLEIKWCNRALWVTGKAEGIYATGFEFTSCGRTGLYAVEVSLSGDYGGAVQLVNGHVDFVGPGVKLTNQLLTKVSNVSFTHSGPANEVSDSTMLWINNEPLVNGFDATISECSFYGLYSSTLQENGVYLSHARSVRIAGNNFSHMQPAAGSCIVVDSASSLIRITDNLFSDVRQKINNLIPQPPPNPPDPYYFGNNPSLP